jgi:hypothetical protein
VPIIIQVRTTGKFRRAHMGKSGESGDHILPCADALERHNRPATYLPQVNMMVHSNRHRSRLEGGMDL